MRLALLALLLAATTAAQAQWDIEDSLTTADLRGIANTGGGAVWASGTNGTVLRSEDGGYLWQPCSIPPGAEALDFRGIQAFDENTAIVMSSGKGDLSRIYKTTDGCHTWKLVFTNPDKEGFWDAIQFSQERRGKNDRCFGVVVGDPVDNHFPSFLTFNCGDSWERQIRESPASLAAGEGLFAASNSSLLVRSQGWRTFVTGGKGGARLMTFWVGGDDTNQPDPLKVAPGAKEFRLVSRGWLVDQIPYAELTESSGAFSIAQKDLIQVIVGGDYAKPAVGMSWCRSRYLVGTKANWTISKTPPHGFRSAVAYDPTHKLWITVGPNGTDISTDNGKNWRALKPLPSQPADADQHWNALSLPFVVGPKGRIGRLNTNALPTPAK
jgi:hypothetical protein